MIANYLFVSSKSSEGMSELKATIFDSGVYIQNQMHIKPNTFSYYFEKRSRFGTVMGRKSTKVFQNQLSQDMDIDAADWDQDDFMESKGNQSAQASAVKSEHASELDKRSQNNEVNLL